MIVVLVCVGCGKKGPPLPPLIKLPVAPADLAAERRGDTVELSFTVPAANLDGTRPANVATADVYAITVPVTVPLSDVNLVKYGTKVGSVEVKAPRDPNITADVDDPSDEVDEPEGAGLDQGALARFSEPLTDEMLTLVDVPRDKNAPPEPVENVRDRPLLGPPSDVPVRTYAALGISTRGKKGPLSKRVAVPLVPPPPPPTALVMMYGETAVRLSWVGANATPPAAEPAAAPVNGLLPSRIIGEGAMTDEWRPVTLPILPSRAIGLSPRTIGYHVYDTTIPDAAIRLTPKPIAELSYVDRRIVWGEERCYIVVAAETVAGVTLESETLAPTCETLVDTFPPEMPKNLAAIASEGLINLIWEPNAEKDLAGYIVLRGPEGAATLEPITPEPIVEPSFKDTVQPGIAYAYAIKAVDRAGNSSKVSARVVETAR